MRSREREKSDGGSQQASTTRRLSPFAFLSALLFPLLPLFALAALAAFLALEIADFCALPPPMMRKARGGKEKEVRWKGERRRLGVVGGAKIVEKKNKGREKKV